MKNNKQEVKVNVINKVHDVIAGNIIQTIQTGDKQTEFLVYGESAVVTVSEYELDESTLLKPVESTYLEHGIITVPSSIQAEGDSRLYLDIFSFIKKYNIVSDEVAMAMTSYSMYTWFQDRQSTAPYMWFVGGFGTGKSRLGNVMRLLCFNSTNLGTAVTDANIFRMQEISRGTLIMDEMNMDFTNKENTFVKIVNGGYSKDAGVVLRSEARGGKQFAPTPHSSFGAKVLISIDEPNDDSLKSRCFVIRTERVDKQLMIDKGIPFDITPQIRKEAELLRNRLLGYRCVHYNDVPYNRVYKFSDSLSPRAQQIIETVLAVLPDNMVNGSKAVLEKHLFEEGVSQAVQEETYISVALNELTVNNREYPLNIPFGDIAGKIFELFYVMYSSKEISKIVKRMKYETKRESAGKGIVIRNVGNVANVGDREDKE